MPESKIVVIEKWNAEVMENMLQDEGIPDEDRKKLKQFKKE
jgi:hypothetical protein